MRMKPPGLRVWIVFSLLGASTIAGMACARNCSPKSPGSTEKRGEKPTACRSIGCGRSRTAGIALFSAGHRAATIDLEGRARIWDAAGQKRISFQATAFPSCIEYSRVGPWVAVARSESPSESPSMGFGGRGVKASQAYDVGLVRFLAVGNRILMKPTGNNSPIESGMGRQDGCLHYQPSAASVAFDSTGSRLAMGAASGEVIVWNLTAEGGMTALSPQPSSWVSSLAFGQDDVLAVVTQAAEHVSLPGLNGPGKRFLGAISVWDLSRKAPLWAHGLEYPTWVGFRPGTQNLATASLKGKSIVITLWNRRGAMQRTYHTDSLDWFAWSHDGALLALGLEGNIEVIPVGTGSPRGVMLDTFASAVAFQPHGGLLAAGDHHGRISLWDIASAEPIRIVLDPSRVIRGLAFNPDGTVLFSAAGRTVRMWDPKTGERLATLEADAIVNAIAVSPDGRLVAAAREDGVVDLWAVPTGEKVATLAPKCPGGMVLGNHGEGRSGSQIPPAHAARNGEPAPGALAARLAEMPSESAPRPGLPGAAPPHEPPSCFTPTLPGRRLAFAKTSGESSVRLCVENWPPSTGPTAPEFPTCFIVDIGRGVYRPDPLMPREALWKFERAHGPSVSFEGLEAKVCREKDCQKLRVTEIPKSDRHEVVVDDAAKLLAVMAEFGDERKRGAVVVYDVKSGRRLGRFSTQVGGASLGFLGGALLVNGRSRAGRREPSVLFEPLTGKPIATVGGDEGLDVSELNPAQMDGDVWAFSQPESGALVFQDVRSGRVVKRVLMPSWYEEGETDNGVQLVHAGDGIAVLPTGRAAGDVIVVDREGKTSAHYRMPVCR